MKLTPQMQSALTEIKARGGFAIPAGGGFWNAGDGRHIVLEADEYAPRP